MWVCLYSRPCAVHLCANKLALMPQVGSGFLELCFAQGPCWCGGGQALFRCDLWPLPRPKAFQSVNEVEDPGGMAGSLAGGEVVEVDLLYPQGRFWYHEGQAWQSIIKWSKKAMVDDVDNAINVVSNAGAFISQAKTKGSYAVCSIRML